MRHSLLASVIIALLVIASLAHAQSENPRGPMLPEIQALWDPHEAAQKTIAADRDKKLANLDYIYLLNVDKLQKDRAAVGDLDGALAAKAELDRLRAHQALTDEQRKAMIPALQALRASYDAALKGYHEEAAKQNAGLLQKLLADLEALQTRITTTGDLDKALRVKAERDRLVAAASNSRPAPTTPEVKLAPGRLADSSKVQPPAPPKTVPSGTTPEPATAKVAARDYTTSPLEAGALWVSIPDRFQGFRYTKRNKSPATLHFKVLTDGLVYMACKSDFGFPRNSAGDWRRELISEAELLQNGWSQLRGAELKTAAKDHVWWIYSRTCKAGEKFSYRTEKFTAPILLVKPGEFSNE